MNIVKIKFLKKYFFLLCLILYCSPNAKADDNKNNYGLNNKLLFTIQYNRLSSTMNEYLYSSDFTHKNSELNHVNKHVPVLTLGLEYRPIHLLTFGFRSSFTIYDNGGKYRLDDYDWLDFSRPNVLTDHSWHTQGKYKYINIDIYGKLMLFRFGKIDKYGLFSFYSFAGFKYIESTATQHGLSYYLYSRLDKDSGRVIELDEYFEDDEDCDDLRYRQRLYLPYYGFSLEYQYKSFQSILTFKQSFINTGDTKDNHFGRDLTSYNKYRNLFNYYLSLNLGYWINNNIRVFTELAMSKTSYNISKYYAYYFDEYNQQYKKESLSTVAMSNTFYYIGIGLNIGF